MIRSRAGAAFFAISLLCLMPGLALGAEEIIGHVMTVKGDAKIVTSGTAVQAVTGTPLVAGSELRTGASGSLGVTLKDNTVMSIGPNTIISVEEFQFAPAKDELRLVARITHGTLNFISGLIAKLRPEAVEVVTPTGTIGVRGTHFLVKVE